MIDRLTDDCSCHDPRDEEIARLKKKLSKRRKKGGKKTWGRGEQYASPAERYEQCHQVRTSTATIPANSAGPLVTRNRYRVMLTIQRIDTGGSPSIIRVHQTGSDPTQGAVPTAFVGTLETRQSNLSGPFVWPTWNPCCIKAIMQSDICGVNLDAVNAQQFSISETFDSCMQNES